MITIVYLFKFDAIKEVQTFCRTWIVIVNASEKRCVYHHISKVVFCVIFFYPMKFMLNRPLLLLGFWNRIESICKYNCRTLSYFIVRPYLATKNQNISIRLWPKCIIFWCSFITNWIIKHLFKFSLSIICDRFVYVDVVVMPFNRNKNVCMGFLWRCAQTFIMRELNK